MRQIIILCSTAVLLAGCSIYKPYSRPDTGVEADSLYGPGVTVEDTASIAARSAFYPSITLGGSAGWTNNAGAIISNPGNWLLSALGSLTQPLFNRGPEHRQPAYRQGAAGRSPAQFPSEPAEGRE